MNVFKAAAIWIDYHKTHSKKKYGSILPINRIGDAKIRRLRR